MFPLSLFISNSLEFSSWNFTITAHQNYAAIRWESEQWTCNEQVFLPWWRPSDLAARSTVNASKDNIPPLDVYIKSILPWKRVSCTRVHLLCLNPRLQGLSMAALQLREVIFQAGCSSVSGVFYPVPNHPFLPWASLDDQPQAKVCIFWHFNLQTTSRVSTYDGPILRNKYSRTL